ncbi:DUF6668 family protein [Carbonactinospora thermoautotrophica]|uniref:DUF6668 family protein n=1 Tax=Carbonactinospora thermoautotrophica TaxID=1469144 RepID=UPI00083597C8|nr:DUF6668 family protein [Carbonactinospora thermoautotrophica]
MSTLAATIPGGVDAARAWPAPPPPGSARVVLVARTHAAGLRAAQAAARQWASGTLPPGIHLLGLVLIADAPGRLPRPLRDLVRLISGGVPRTWLLPWVEALRLGEPPSRVALPAEYTRLATDLHHIAYDRGGSYA